MTAERTTDCLDLPFGNPSGIQALQTKITEANLVAGLGLTTVTATLKLSVFGFLRT
jgi:hypothetical protein